MIEVIAERLYWKLDLHTKVAPHLSAHATVASNTSGLSITELAKALPAPIQSRFCGIPFFNPLRCVQRVGLIPEPGTDGEVLDPLETFVTRCLGKGTVRAKDTASIVAKRLGIAAMLGTIKAVEHGGLTPEVVDRLTGKPLGRASSGTARIADLVGVDTPAQVVRTLQGKLGSDQSDDPFYARYATPVLVVRLTALARRAAVPPCRRPYGCGQGRGQRRRT